MSYGHRSNRAPRDGRCTKYLETGGGRCTDDALPGEILCARHMLDRKQWGQRLRPKRPRDEEGQPVQPPLPDWMRDPSLLPKKPPGRV